MIFKYAGTVYQQKLMVHYYNTYHGVTYHGLYQESYNN